MMATKEKKKVKPPKKPAQVFKEYCETYPWAVECKVHEV
tara:strand:- start:947 stop:1063 length:117 start_codon:yes stop_codon:yes gene_type:complete